jgi:wee1-like protein kinase
LHSIQKPSNSSNRRISEFNLSRLEKDYIYERKLGEGNFSFVGLYKFRMTGDFFAVKITKSSKMSVNEVQALGALSILSQRCKNIVRYFHSWVENNELHLVMEYCKESLTTLLDRQRYSGLRFKEEFIKNVLKQSLQGLKTMHENKMVHLDLKPDNLLVKENVIKISDLGLTRLNHLKRASELDEGDSRYLAREVLNYYPSIDLTKADIFSLGLTIFEMLSLEPLPNNGEFWVSIRDNGLSLTDRMDLQ